MSAKELRVLLNEREIGSVLQDARGKFRFVYDAAWRALASAIPLSLSMPLTAAEHGDRAIQPFMWGLLPDHEETLAQWGQRYGVSPRNPFGLLSHIGEDLQGAIQMVPPDRLGELKKREGATLLSQRVLRDGFAELLRMPGATRFTQEGGQFSLAGAQRKKALYRVNGRWYEPRGRTPSTHILKPPIPGFAGQIENELFCLRLAPKLGLPAPNVWIENFGGISVLVVERYDRQRIAGKHILALDARGGEVHRIHQEDCCQALMVMPQTKYENEGGPGIRRIMELLSGSGRPAEDRDRFMRANVFNFVIGGSDAHAKNYGLLLSSGGRFRLAPLYDIISGLLYFQRKGDARLAMAIDRCYRLDEIMPRHWEAAARACGFNPNVVLAHIRDVIAQLPDTATTLLAACKKEGIAMAELNRLSELLIARCKTLRRLYGAEALPAAP
jgi:serine/threonine-protein kinase HipA